MQLTKANDWWVYSWTGTSNSFCYKNESIEGMSHARVLYTFQTNIIAMFDLTRLAIPYMPKGASIINVGSVQAWVHSSTLTSLKNEWTIRAISFCFQLSTVGRNPWLRYYKSRNCWFHKRLVEVDRILCHVVHWCTCWRSCCENVGERHSSELCCSGTCLDTADSFKLS